MCDEIGQKRENEKAGHGARHFYGKVDSYCGLAGGVVAFLVAVPVVLLVVVAAGFLVAATGCRGSTIFTCMTFGGLNGRSLRGSVARRVICFTNSGLSHCPKMVCLPFRCGVGTSVMKNCEPLVCGPLLAMARRPGWSKARSLNSSLKL